MSNTTGKMKQLRALEIGKGIQYLLNEACRILGNPVLTHDMEFNLIACTENVVTDDLIWNEVLTTGRVSRNLMEFYKNESFFDAAANAKKITFLPSDKLRDKRILGKLFSSENIQIGCASIKEDHQPFDDDDPVLFEFFCDVLNREIAKSEHFRVYGQAYQETLINKLIEGSIDDREIYTAHVESIYRNLKEYLYLAVIDTAQSNPTFAELSHLRDMLKRAQPAFKYSIYADRVVMIISSDSAVLDAKKAMCKLGGLIKQNGLRIGISECFDNLYELQKYYAEAVDALNHAPG